MGIEKVELYVCICDNCGSNYECDDLYIVYPTKEDADDSCRNNGEWEKEGDKYYCTECYVLDEDGYPILDESRKKVEPDVLGK